MSKIEKYILKILKNDYKVGLLKKENIFFNRYN